MSIRTPAPDATQAAGIEATKQLFENVEAQLLTLPSNRERSLALTKLEEASMWATKAIILGAK